MPNIAYQSHISRMHAIGAVPLSYTEWIYLAMRCIAQNCAEYEAKQNRVVSVRPINQK